MYPAGELAVLRQLLSHTAAQISKCLEQFQLKAALALHKKLVLIGIFCKTAYFCWETRSFEVNSNLDQTFSQM